MIEYLFTTLLGTFALGLITWHIVRVISQGYLFEALRKWLEKRAHAANEGQAHPLWLLWWNGWACRLCFHTEVAIALTWGLLSTGLVVDRHVLPGAGWGFAFAVGPFLTAAWAEVVQRVECLEVPE